MRSGSPSPSRAPFESCIEALDQSVSASARRGAQAARRLSKATRRSKGEESFPLHDSEDTLNAALLAVSQLSGIPVPDAMQLSSDPKTVYEWTLSSANSFGNECRGEGASMVREASAPRVPPEHAREALRLMTVLNAMLTKSGTGK